MPTLDTSELPRFVDVINDPAYREFKHLRDEAVATAVLQPTTPAI